MTSAVQLDLLDFLERASHPVPPLCLFGSPARGLPAREAENDAWKDEYGAFGCVPRSHAWHVSITHPGAPTEACRPTVLDADLRCCDVSHGWGRPCFCVGDLLHRGACTGCDWEAGPRAEEWEAAEDAHDHAWPGWRDLPAVRHRPKDKKADARWAEEVAALYPPGWITSGGPVRVPAQPGWRPHIPGYGTPYGGYQMGVIDEEAG